MGIIQREIDRIRQNLIDGTNRHDELYAAQQALEWALDPNGIKSPYTMITGTQEGSEGCLARRHQPRSSNTCSRNG